jgi:hypothetical protein
MCQLVKLKQSTRSDNVGIYGRMKMKWALQEQALFCR